MRYGTVEVVYFVGLDLAWGVRNQTGIAVLDADGRLECIRAAVTDQEILATIDPYVRGDCVVGIDAPLIVPNEHGFREGETLFNRDFSRYQAGAQPANKANPLFEPPRGALIARQLDLDMDPDSQSPRRAIEVYPHAATISLFRLGRTLKYKRRNRDAASRKAALLRLLDLIESLEDHTPALHVRHHREWTELRERVELATRPFELNACEDPIDAVLCAYVAMFSALRSNDTAVYGDVETGYIVTPALPHDLSPAPPEPTPGVVNDDIAAYAARRPALVASTDRYLELVTSLLDEAGINYLSVTARTKTVTSFAEKADRSIGGRRLYTNPLAQITDQIGLRVVTYLRDDVAAVANLLGEEMQLLADRDMGLETAREGRWGYASRHLMVRVDGEQQAASVQVRTVLQHAWAEFEHDIRYKGSVSEHDAPELDRRFTLAAGLLELADREFSAIRERLRASAPEPVSRESSDPRIDVPELASYLGIRFPDAGWSRTEHYAWMSSLLLELGVVSLDELDTVLDVVDTDGVNERMGYRFPAGAVRRLDDALLAQFGDRYVALDGNAHRTEQLTARLERLG